MKKFIFVGSLLAQLIFIPAFAGTYYVDNAISTSGNGTSWASAWKNFSNISWSSVKGGDIIYISGGSINKTYYETLTIGAVGSAGNPIVIARAIDAGHKGTIIIDGQYSRSYAVYMDGKNHVIVRGFRAENHTECGFRIRNITAGVIIEDNDVFTGTPNKGGNARGYDVRSCRNSTQYPVIVRRNNYSTTLSSNDQTDGIWSSDNERVLFERNHIVISNSYTGANDGHNDCLQSYTDHSLYIIDNYCEHNDTKTGNAQGIWIENISGTATVINNIVYAPNTYDGLITTKNAAGYSGNIKVYNNTCYGSKNGILQIDNSPNSIIKNNIFYTPHNGQAFKITGTEPPKGNIDYNLLYSPNSSYPAYITGINNFTWATWTNRGYEAHGLNADPKFKNIAGKDFSLASNSPAINKGASISEVTTDFAGIARPQGMAYDIGAYEFVSVSTEISGFISPDFIYCYPNPFNTNFTVLISSTIILENAMISIYDVCGKEVKNISINSHQTIIDKGELRSGIYFYNIINDNEKIANGKIVVQD